MPPREWARACPAPSPALLKDIPAAVLAMESCSRASMSRSSAAGLRFRMMSSIDRRACISVNGEAMRDT